MPIELEATISQQKADQMLRCTHQVITFHGHILKKLDFSDKNLSEVFFAGVWIEDTSFQRTKCNKTSFYGSFLENVDFSGADLSKAVFRESKLTNCNLNKIHAPLWKKIYLWLKNS
jgi:uncharacterized protein YjbI with pentapeptide repeats